VSERRVWAILEDWVDGTPGDATFSLLRELGAERSPEDWVVYLAGELAVCREPAFRAKGAQFAARLLLHERVQRETALRVSRGFDDRGIEHAFFKGTDLRYRVYPDPLRRQSVDVDVLLAPRRREAAVEAIRSIGAGLLEDPERFLRGRHHELSTRVGEVGVDLHTTLLQPGRSRLDTDEILARQVRVEVDGGSLPVPERGDAILLCLAHIGRHEGLAEYVGLKHGLDVLLACRAWDDLDWDELAARAERWRIRRLAGAGLWTWALPMRGFLPDSALHALDPGGLQRYLAVRTRGLPGGPKERQRGIGRARQLVRKLAFAEGWRERLWLLGELGRRAGADARQGGDRT